MAAFNATQLKELLAKIDEGREIAKSIREIGSLEIPLDVAIETKLEETLLPMRRIEVVKDTITTILEKLEAKKAAKAAEQKARRNELARERRQKRKLTEKEGSEKEAKRAKEEGSKENVPKKVPAPKKKPETALMKKTKQMAKCMLRQRR